MDGNNEKKEEKENINLQIHLKQYLYKICQAYRKKWDM